MFHVRNNENAYSVIISKIWPEYSFWSKKHVTVLSFPNIVLVTQICIDLSTPLDTLNIQIRIGRKTKLFN